MPGLWEKYAQPQSAEPWKKYGAAPDQPGITAEPKSIGGFGANVLASGGRLASDIATAVTSPWQTAKGLGNLVLGLAEKVIPGEQPEEKNIDALVDFYKQRYGGLSNIGNTLYTDPIGALADLSTVAGGAGLAAKGVGLAAKTANLGKAATLAEQVARVAGTVSEVTDPIRNAVRGAGVAARATGLPERLYESALKPSLAVKNLPKIPGQVATGLREGIPVSEAGAKKLAGLIDDLQTEIDAKITGSTATIDPYAVAQRAEGIKPQWAQQVNPKADLSTIDRKIAEWKSLHETPGSPGSPAVPGPMMTPAVPPIPPSPIPIPVQKAQEIKKGTYQQLRKKYGELGSAETETEKALARGVKEEIATAIPEIGSLNAQESKLLGLDTVLEKAVARIRNHQIFGIGTPLAAAGAGAVTGSPQVALVVGTMRAILDNPQVKSKIAIAIDRARRINPDKWGLSRSATATSRVQEYIDSLNAATEQ